jgi:hypothetical protein
VFVEPIVSLAYVASNVDEIATSQGSFSFDEGDGLLGKIGGRIGSGIGKNKSIYFGGHYVHEFEGEDMVTFLSGGQTVDFGNTAIGDYGELFAGISIGDRDGAISGSFEGHYATGGDLEGYGASANIKFRF